MSIPIRAPPSPAAANCRSAPATASRSRRPRTTTSEPLDGRCDVVVSGVTPAARFWTLTLYDQKGHLVANSLQRYGFTSQEIIRGADGALRDPRRVAVARRQLAADRRHRALCADAAALRYAGRRGDADPARCADALDCDGGVPMIRLLFTIIAGVLLGGVVHLVSVLALPRIATQDAYSRLTPMTKLNAVTALPLADPEQRADAVHGSGVRDRDLPLRSVGRPDQAHGAGQPGLHLGVVLHAQRGRLLRHQRPLRRHAR